MIRNDSKIVLLILFLFAVAACKTSSQKPEKVGLKIIETNQWQFQPNVRQVLVVFNTASDDYHANLLTFEKTEQGWQPVFEVIPAGVGENGFCPN